MSFDSFSALRDSLMSNPSFVDFIEETITVQANPTSTYDPATLENVLSYAISIETKGFFAKFNQSQLVGELQNSDALIVVDSKDITEKIQPNSNILVGSKKYTVIDSEPANNTAIVIQRCYCKGVNNA